MQKKIETIILGKLFTDEDYMRKVIPFIKEEYIQDVVDKTIFQQIKTFISKYNALPTLDAISIALDKEIGRAHV